jgi:hypothetical protein
MEKMIMCCLLFIGFNAVYAQNDTIKTHEIIKNDWLIYIKDCYKIKDLTIVMHTTTDEKGFFLQRFKMVHKGEFYENKERYTYDETGRVRKYERYNLCGIEYRIIYDEKYNIVSEGKVEFNCGRR